VLDYSPTGSPRERPEGVRTSTRRFVVMNDPCERAEELRPRAERSLDRAGSVEQFATSDRRILGKEIR